VAQLSVLDGESISGAVLDSAEEQAKLIVKAKAISYLIKGLKFSSTRSDLVDRLCTHMYPGCTFDYNFGNEGRVAAHINLDFKVVKGPPPFRDPYGKPTSKNTGVKQLSRLELFAMRRYNAYHAASRGFRFYSDNVEYYQKTVRSDLIRLAANKLPERIIVEEVNPPHRLLQKWGRILFENSKSIVSLTAGIYMLQKCGVFTSR
jgi:hypothetical protein